MSQTNNSNDGIGGGSSPNKPSPGKGGKSLQIMQQRMQMASQQQPSQPGGPGVSTGENPSTSIPAASSGNQTVPTVVQPRSKGKDFANMSAHNPNNQKPSGGLPPVASAPPVPAHTGPSTSATASGGKSKGKDFSAMASRMPTMQQNPSGGAPPPQPALSQEKQLEQMQVARDRAARLQAEARAAVGLPPLDRPTATSVTTIPPNIPPPRSSGPLPATSSTATGQPVVAALQQNPYESPGKTTDKPPAVSRRTSSAKSKKPTSAPTPADALVFKTITSVTQTPTVGPRLQELVHSVDPNYTIDPDAEEQLLQLADDFLEKLVKQSTRLANHRNSKTLDIQDVQMTLWKQWDIVVPGLGPPPSKKVKTSQVTKRSGQPKST